MVESPPPEAGGLCGCQVGRRWAFLRADGPGEITAYEQTQGEVLVAARQGLLPEGGIWLPGPTEPAPTSRTAPPPPWLLLLWQTPQGPSAFTASLSFPPEDSSARRPGQAGTNSCSSGPRVQKGKRGPERGWICPPSHSQPVVKPELGPHSPTPMQPIHSAMPSPTPWVVLAYWPGKDRVRSGSGTGPAQLSR